MDALESVNDLIAGLYRYGRDVPIGDFQRWALERLREVIAFDSAAWGTSSESPRSINAVHLHVQPREVIEAYVRDGWQAKDFLRAACVANPGVAVNVADLMSPAGWRRTAMYRQFARPHGIEWVLCAIHTDPQAPVDSFVALTRGDRQRPFSDQDRRRFQVLLPHLIEAMRANHAWHFEHATAPKHALPAFGMGVSDRAGIVHDCNRSFSRLIRSEWPGWAGATLPAVLVASFARGTFVGQRIDVDAEPLGDQWLLRARAGGAAKQLGRRERQVAELYARGMDYREIARTVGVAPTTVRNQIRASFRKLGVTSKLDLARRLGEGDFSFLQ
jgi:DNA-binding CsgD family transcriptional regulator